MCEIFFDDHFLNAQFMFYSLIVCYEIHIKLVHVNVCWIETIVYRVICDEMFVRKFLIHTRIFKSCRDVCQMIYISQFLICLHARIWFLFVCFNANEMFCNWSIFRLFDSITYVLKYFSSKCSIRCVSHQKLDQKLFAWAMSLFISSIRFTILSYWFQDVFIEMFDQNLSRWRFFFQTWWHVWRLFNFQFCLVVNASVTYQK